MAWLRKARPATSGAKELRQAEIDNARGKLIADGEEYDLRKIQNVELIRKPDNEKVLDVYIGYLNPAKRTMFTRVAVDRIFAGSTKTSSDIAGIFRNQFRQFGVPVIEL